MPSPMIKATLYAASLSSASNFLAQILDAYRKELPFAFDAPQFLRFVTLALLTAPPNYRWQQYLEHWFPSYESRLPLRDIESGRKEKGDDDRPASEKTEKIEAHEGGPAHSPSHQQDQKQLKLNWRNTFAKWFIDCITVGAVLNTVAFFILMGVLKGQTTAQIGHNIRHETIPLIVAGFRVWPFASIISFSCVPVEKRIIFLNFVGLLWGIYMSLVAARV